MASTVYVGTTPASHWARLMVKVTAATRGEALADAAASYIALCARGRGIGSAAYTRRCYDAIAARREAA